MELEEELKVVGNSLKSLEVSEEKVISQKLLYIIKKCNTYHFFRLIIEWKNTSNRLSNSL